MILPSQYISSLNNKALKLPYRAGFPPLNRNKIILHTACVIGDPTRGVLFKILMTRTIRMIRTAIIEYAQRVHERHLALSTQLLRSLDLFDVNIYSDHGK